MRYKLFFIGILISFSMMLKAQDNYNLKGSPENKLGIVYDKEVSASINLHTNGYAFSFDKGTIKTYYKTRYYHFEIGEIKHPKEYKNRQTISSSGPSQLRTFSYGKQNNLYAIRMGVGQKRYYSEKASHNGLAIGINYEFGFTLGVVKPYYLKMKNLEGNDVTEKFSENNAETFLDIDKISGSAGFTTGLQESSLVPGGHFKVGLHFDWGAFDEFLKAMEIGIMGDVFTKSIPIMVDEATIHNNQNKLIEILPANVANRPFFFNVYVSLQLGKRK